jgi:hypothetical protein
LLHSVPPFLRRHQDGGGISAPLCTKILCSWTSSTITAASAQYVLFCRKLFLEFTSPLSCCVCCSLWCLSTISWLDCSYSSTAHVSWAWSNFLCLLHSIHNFLVVGLRHRLLIHTSGYWLFCSQDGIGFVESFFWTYRRLSVTLWLLCWIGIYKTKNFGLRSLWHI